MGHHVQQQLGTSDEVRQLQREDPGQANPLSVRLELQADCYAGVWANTVYEENALERGDIEEAVSASEAIGDDRLQRQATGRNDSFSTAARPSAVSGSSAATGAATRANATPSRPSRSEAGAAGARYRSLKPMRHLG